MKYRCKNLINRNHFFSIWREKRKYHISKGWEESMNAIYSLYYYPYEKYFSSRTGRPSPKRYRGLMVEELDFLLFDIAGSEESLKIPDNFK